MIDGNPGASRFFHLDSTEDCAPRKPESLTDQAYAAIRQRIVTCKLLPGTTFIEADLSEQLGMSKTPVREALLRLQVEGLVQAIPRRGYTVRPIHVADINDAFDFRLVIEGASAERAATRATDAEIAALRELAEFSSSEHDAIPGDDFEAVSRQGLINNVFHESVAIAARSHRLHLALVQAIREYDRLFYLEWSAPAGYPRDHKDHREVVRVLALREPALAREAMTAHIEGARGSLLSALASSSNPLLGALTRI
ncbi:GntR family transcriptional regulator [Tropicimonas sp. IMCC34043]|uniref:GntR family transcriptional regulator n=1 Tax=Tropicimonas sp. IMCC34043 TaxID=2248760 RepID=UPI001E5E91DD|nr:GntR family transcriptional regulator [Tropicimonas sp. IMCC34043]